ncbi:MAG: DegT/DnrJ/EryC1/StrS family aminotransferase [Nitrospira sp.]|nr:DegT/DnrJ/EryC1/StrS family aminotransferase [Nitrospira sp.]
MISVFGSCVGQEEIDEIRSSFENQWLGIGAKTRSFESLFAHRLGLKDFVFLDNGSNSLYMAVKLLNLSPGSEVILPSFTWVACAHAVILAGAVPVLCDVDMNTQNVTADTIAPHISSKTRAIMVVHYAGKPVRMEPVLSIGQPVIEDAAQAVDSKLGNKYCGSLGTIGVYSFDPVKNITTGEGGGITTNDSELMTRARQLRYCGIGKAGVETVGSKERWWEYDIVDVSPKLLPNDIAASIGLAQLRKIDKFQTIRRTIWNTYQAQLADFDWLIRPRDPASDEQHSYFTYSIRVSRGKRDQLAKYLYSRDIYTTVRFHPLHMNPLYKTSYRLPISEQLNEEILSLPLHPNLSDSDIDEVLLSLQKFNAQYM